MWPKRYNFRMFDTPNGERNTMPPDRRYAGVILAVRYCIFVLATAAISSQPNADEAWHLLRTANPRGGADAMSMSHTADMTRSDLDLAGLLLRCNTGPHNTGLEPREIGSDVVIVVVTPFPPRAKPSVAIGAAGNEWHFEASVLSPGAELLLPAEAASLAAGPWQSAHELSIKVSFQERTFAGVIPIDGMAAALATLAANCPAS
jgi:hypothetical protein